MKNIFASKGLLNTFWVEMSDESKMFNDFRKKN